MQISVIGLGKLGSVIATIFSSSGHQVTGVDLNVEILESLKNGQEPFKEPGLQDLINNSKLNLTVTNNLDQAINNSNVTLIVVPTPSTLTGEFSNQYIIDVLQQVSTILKNKKTFHTIVINSTVMPNSCFNTFIPLIESSSNKKVGTDIGLIYSPQFIALGSILHDLINPDLVLIGESDRLSGEIFCQLWRSIVLSKPEIHHMNLLNAEIAKLAVNTFVTTKISFANMLGEICQNLPNSDVNVITNALGSDTRIGKKYLKSALGYGGPCFPRDNLALIQVATRLNISCDLAVATHSINQRQAARYANLILSYGIKNIAVLGLTYKPNTPVLEESQSLLIIKYLSKYNLNIYVHDPFHQNNIDLNLNEGVKIENDIEKIVSSNELIFLATPHPIYLDLKKINLNKKIVIDPWGLLK